MMYMPLQNTKQNNICITAQRMSFSWCMILLVHISSEMNTSQTEYKPNGTFTTGRNAMIFTLFD